MREIQKFCKLQEEGPRLIQAAMSQLNLLSCAYQRILKLAPTTADLAGPENIQLVCLAEACQYLPKLMIGQSYLVRQPIHITHAKSVRPAASQIIFFPIDAC